MNFITTWILPLLLAFLPFSKGFLQFEVGFITLNPYSLGIILLSAVSILKIFRPKDTPFGLSVTDIFIVALCLTYLFSTLLSDTLIESGYLAFHALFIPTLSYFVIKINIRTKEQLQRTYLILTLGLLCFGAIQFISFLKTFRRNIVLDMNPIDFSTLCIVGILYLLYVRGLKKFSVLFMLLPLVLFLLINLSRAYILALLLSPLLYFMVRKGKAAILMVALLGGTLFITAFLASNTKLLYLPESQVIRGEAVSGIERVTNLTFWQQSLYRRGIHFKEGFQEFFKAPIVGQGMKKGRTQYSWQRTFFTWHSFIIQWLVFGGAIGFLLYAGVFLANFSLAGKYARTDKMTTAILTSISIIMINGATNGLMHGMMPYAIFILLGFSESRIRDLSIMSKRDH